MKECAEITVTIKSDESTYKQKFLEYETFSFSQDDPVIKSHVAEALSNAKIEPDDIKIIAKLQVK